MKEKRVRSMVFYSLPLCPGVCWRWRGGKEAATEVCREDGSYGRGGPQTQRQVVTAGALSGHQW